VQRNALVNLIPYAVWFSILATVVVAVLALAGIVAWWWIMMPPVLGARFSLEGLAMRRRGLVVSDEGVRVWGPEDRKLLVIPAEKIVAYRAHPDGRIEIAYLDPASETDSHTFTADVRLVDPAAALEELRFRFGSRTLEEVSEDEGGG
jgi:hypothetical protein